MNSLNSMVGRRSILTSFILMVSILLYAEPIDENQARYAAASFFSPTSSKARLRAKGQQMKLQSKGHESGYYIFERPEGGVVFVADDDAIGRTVLGYTEQGGYDPDNLPIGLQDWLGQVTVLMDAVHDGKIERTDVRRKAGSVVVQGLIKTKWDQIAPFNNLCPITDGKRCITGCVATAMAQVMKYWEWPKHGYGSKTYYDEKGCKQSLSQDFSLNTYDWDNMLNEYKSASYMTGVEATAVATLMRDCGYAVEMTYTPDASGANINAYKMRTYFHYSPIAVDRNVSTTPEEMWHEFIRNDLSAGRPVLYNGQGTEGGHEFILDGFDSEGYYHVNWGWGGYDDGWFMLTNLNGYNDDQWMINNLEPDRTNDDSFSYTLEDDVLTINGQGIIPAEYSIGTAPWSDDCYLIRKIVIGEGITGIGNGFGYGDGKYYGNLEEVSLPEGLKSIGEDAFCRSWYLTSVKLPSSLVSLYYSFYKCRNLTSLHLPEHLENFYDDLPSLNRLTVDENNPWLTAEDNLLYSKDGKNLLFIPQGLSKVIISDKTEGIYEYAPNIFSDALLFFKGKKAPLILSNSLYFYYVSNSGRIFIPYESTGYTGWKNSLPSGWKFMTYTDLDYFLKTSINWTSFDAATEPIITAYHYNGEQTIYKLDDWEKLLTTTPNAVGLVAPGKEFVSKMSRNLIVADSKAKSGYRCSLFRLTDLSFGYSAASKAPQTGFYTPVPFDVTEGEYNRKLTTGYNTACLPFAIAEDGLPEGCKMYGYSHFDSENSDAVFVAKATAEAGQACFITCEKDVTWQTDLSGTVITDQQPSTLDANMRGTFATTDAYKGLGYNPRVADNVFAPLEQYLHPFRACFIMSAPSASTKIHIRLDDDAITDAIRSVSAGPTDALSDIFTLDGKRAISTKKGQPYIQNGKVVIK